VQDFIENRLYGRSISLDSQQTIRNLSEMDTTRAIYTTFKRAIDALTVSDKGTAEIRYYIKLRNSRPITETNKPYYIPQKSIFNKIVSDNRYELAFASFLDSCPDVISFAMNQRGVYFKIEYQGEDGNIHEYFPDFFVKTGENIFIVETKGREDLDDLRKIDRLRQWCRDVNALNPSKIFIPLYVKQEDFEKNRTRLKSLKNVQSIGKIQ
jgi:type III restriction enzyme